MIKDLGYFVYSCSIPHKKMTVQKWGEGIKRLHIWLLSNIRFLSAKLIRCISFPDGIIIGSRRLALLRIKEGTPKSFYVQKYFSHVLLVKYCCGLMSLCRAELTLNKYMWTYIFKMNSLHKNVTF